MIALNNLARIDGAALDELRGACERVIASDWYVRGEEAATQVPLQTAINQHFATQKTVAEMIASLEGESRPAFQSWARKTATLLKTRSPTLLEVTRRQINRGGKLSLVQCCILFAT